LWRGYCRSQLDLTVTGAGLEKEATEEHTAEQVERPSAFSLPNPKGACYFSAGDGKVLAKVAGLGPRLPHAKSPRRGEDALASLDKVWMRSTAASRRARWTLRERVATFLRSRRKLRQDRNKRAGVVPARSLRV
jgi:ribonuclease PH